MYSEEIAHVLRHLSRLRQEVEEKMKNPEMQFPQTQRASVFLGELQEVYETTREFLIRNYNLGLEPDD